MTNNEAKDLVREVFSEIEQAKSVHEIKKIIENRKESQQYLMNTTVYPKLNFSISIQEIEILKNSGFLTSENSVSNDIINLAPPLAKLFYATLWKNGDLHKIKHIVEGIIESDSNDSSKENALVFYQFGKYLTRKESQPIIDQHVIRAFAVYQAKDDIEVLKSRKINIINKSHNNIIKEYKKWLTEKPTSDLRNDPDYTYYVDQLVFAVGKAMKVSRFSDIVR